MAEPTEKQAMSDADRSRARPGYRWGVAVRSSGERKEVEPPCACPCHLADAPGPSSWYCDKCWGGVVCFTTEPGAVRVPYSHEQAIADGLNNPRPYTAMVPDYYYLTCGNTLKDGAPRRHFKTKEAADKAAQLLNDEDAVASLNVPASYRARFDRYRKLHTYFGWAWYDGKRHPLTRLPAKPGRYAVETYGDGDTYWRHYETLDEVRALIEEDDEVNRVVDLDSGEDVAFRRSVHVSI